MKKKTVEQFTAQTFQALLSRGYIVARLYVCERWISRDPTHPDTKTRAVNGKLELYIASIEEGERRVFGLQRDIQHCPADPTAYLYAEPFIAKDSRGEGDQTLDELLERWRKECPEWLEKTSEPVAIYDSERGGRQRIGIAHALLVRECAISFTILAMLIKRCPNRKLFEVLSSRLNGLLDQQVRSCDQATRAFLLA